MPVNVELTMPKKKEPPQPAKAIAPIEAVEDKIFILRGQKVMLDSDLADLYGVETRTLNQAVKRNINRFPQDFLFQLTREEAQALLRSRSQSVILKRGKNVKYAPYAFTEHGAVMLATILRSQTAIDASIHVVRAFVRMRSILAAHRELAKQLERLEKNTDARFKAVFNMIKKLMQPPTK